MHVDAIGHESGEGTQEGQLVVKMMSLTLEPETIGCDDGNTMKEQTLRELARAPQ